MQKNLLVDNGSIRSDSVLNLRRLANQLSTRIGGPVAPVSLQHAKRIPADQLGGEPARLLHEYLSAELERGVRDFLLLPLFFGASKAISSFIPDTVECLQQSMGDFQLKVADVLCPLPVGEPALAEILAGNLNAMAQEAGTNLDAFSDIILVDHGSPSPRVTAVREKLATQLQPLLPTEVTLHQAVMERRPGKEYDFNGPLLKDLLGKIGVNHPSARVALSMLFLSPGRHAGRGGDVETICAEVKEEFRGLAIDISPLVTENPDIVHLLEQRWRAAKEELASR
ncbi:MAG: sirohydrochlorin chelatase [bacterium]